MVERFIAQMQVTNKDAYIFAAITSGGPVFGMIGMLKRALKQKRIRLKYGKMIVSVTNYLPEYEAKGSEALWQRVEAQIDRVAGAVIKRKVKWMPSLSFLNRLFYKAYPDENCDQYFSIAPSCKGCTTCQKICPTGNIIMKAGKPDFKHQCEHCLACLHNCPASALDWQNKTQGKARYRNAQVSLEELIAFITCVLS